MDGERTDNPSAARQLLRDVAQKWPTGSRVMSISTCGAFLTFDWPLDVPRRGNLKPDEEEVRRLFAHAGALCDEVVDADLQRALAAHADYLTIGIDSKKRLISTTNNQISEPHTELVVVINLKSGSRHWTGKFYPTVGQTKSIIRIPDLDSHFVKMNGKKVMILGCHDLTVFNPRSQARAKGWRRHVSSKFRTIAKREAPVFVLHHPHTTVKAGTWRNALSELRRALPSVVEYLGTGAYSMRDFGWPNRTPLNQLLRATKSAGVLDIVVHLGSRDKEKLLSSNEAR